jgi:hypothetical protein
MSRIINNAHGSISVLAVTLGLHCGRLGHQKVDVTSQIEIFTSIINCFKSYFPLF